ncbi:MAG: aminoglycoside phosphotransferase family protein [Eudoraea sp.]
MKYPGLSLIASQFEIETLDYEFKEINQGYINNTFFVLVEGIPKYILQRINKGVFPNIPTLMENMVRSLNYLSGEGYQSISLIPTKNKKPFLTLEDGKCWRMMTAIENSIAYSTSEDPVIAYETGRILVRFHSLLQKAPKDKFQESLVHFHDLEYRGKQFYQALEMPNELTIEPAKNAINFAKKNLQLLLEAEPTHLPIRICHNDTKLNNILFHKDDKKALCLIDLDTIMPGRFYYDFGDAIRTLVNTSPEDEKDLTKINFSKTQFESCIDGMKEHSSFLRQDEIESLAFGAVLMPFLHGLRALTDYLDGNKYYKVTYENQNLDRCLSLFEFTKLGQINYDYMEETIIKKFKL